MFRQVSLTTLIRPLLFLAILFVAMVLYLSERQNAIDRQVRKAFFSKNEIFRLFTGHVDWHVFTFSTLIINLKVDLIIKNVEEMQESQQRLLDEQLQLSLDTNKTGLSISSHDSQIDLLEQYTKVCYFRTKKWYGRQGSSGRRRPRRPGSLKPSFPSSKSSRTS